MRVLVIDDSPAIRHILRKMMAELGAEAVEAGNGIEGLSRLHQDNAVDLIIVDWNMPEMDGLEFIENVRADAAYDNIPILMATTENTMDRVTEALQAGANEYVMKPFTKDIITAKLDLLGIEHV
jgi:two-component system chemotaxis response regulator CheY